MCEREHDHLSLVYHHVPALPIFDLQNLPDPLTHNVQDVTEQSEPSPAAVDRWLNANRDLWHRAGACLIVPNLLGEMVTCEVQRMVKLVCKLIDVLQASTYIDQ